MGIKAAIPKECFERSALHSFYFVLRDSVMAAGLVFAAYSCLSTDMPSEILSTDMLKWVVGWNLYAFWQGTVLTGHWVLAHECGHGAFSSSQVLNDIVGYVIHQALLVPYFAWQYTHAKHHRRTNHLTDGESHVPTTGIENGLDEHGERQGFYAVWHEAMGDGVFAGFQVWAHLFIGWPLYLLGLASTGKVDVKGKPLNGRIMDHFRPTSPMFPQKISHKITLSTIATVLTLIYVFVIAPQQYGFMPVLLWYLNPYVFANAWLVMYTWLQHTDPSVPQYGESEWTWVRGALTTIDRPYGIFDFFHHEIGSTHVTHHFFHEIPHYNAGEATAAIKAFLEPKGLYNYDPTPWWKAMWRIANTCHFVDDVEGIQYYRSFNDVPKSKDMAAKKQA